MIPQDVSNLQKIKGHDEIFSEALQNSNSVIAVLGSNVSSLGTYERKAKARFLSKVEIQIILLTLIHIQ